MHFQTFANRIYDRRERERNEALTEVEAMLLGDGRPAPQLGGEVQHEVRCGVGMSTSGFDLNEVL